MLITEKSDRRVLRLSESLTRRLGDNGVMTLEDILRKGRRGLRLMRGVGTTSISIICRRMEELGFHVPEIEQDEVTPQVSNPFQSAQNVALRDYFAGQALAGLHAHPKLEEWSEETVADFSYKVADAMMRRREEPVDNGPDLSVFPEDKK